MSKSFKTCMVAVLAVCLLALLTGLAVAAPNVENSNLSALDQYPDPLNENAEPCPTPLVCVDGVDANGDLCGFCYCPSTQNFDELWDKYCSMDPVDPPVVPPSNPPPNKPPPTDQPQPGLYSSKLPNTGTELAVIAALAIAAFSAAFITHRVVSRKNK